jgi:mannitol/fructose-specific phosphotransferase system IIA component (Ntr-type)
MESYRVAEVEATTAFDNRQRARVRFAVHHDRSRRGLRHCSSTGSGEMELREFFSEDAIKLELEGETKDDVLKELIGLLKLGEKEEGMLYKMLKRRENLGSTGIGRGIAIPHCRSLVVNKLRVAFGRKTNGMDFKAIDEKPVNFFFLIVAPPLEVSNQYLPVLGKIAQFSKEPDVPQRLLALTEPVQFLELLKEKGV